jgi:hypothetical protein
MPTYDGIGSSVTHEIEVVGDVFISNVEGGSLSTQVPFEIFSNVFGLSPAPTDSRQLRLRVQPTSDSNVSNSYVTDMGIQNTTDNYFFITAPQNTSNVGDQNTFVISTTGNVGIGTADPKTKLHVSHDLHLQASSEAWNSTAGPGLYLRYSTNGGQDEGYIQSIDRTTPTKKPMVLEASNFYFNGGDVGIGVASPNYTLDVNGGVRTRLPWLYARNTSQGGYSTSYNVTFNLVEARDTTVGDMYNTSYACTFPVKGVYVVDIFTHSALGGQHTAWYQGYIRYSNGTAYYLVSGNKQQSPTAANWDTYTENTWVLYVPTSNMYLDLTFYTSLSTIKNYAGSWNRIRAACIYAVQ